MESGDVEAGDVELHVVGEAIANDLLGDARVEFGAQGSLLRFVDDKDLMFLAEVLKVPVQELFPPREKAGKLSAFMEKLETTRF